MKKFTVFLPAPNDNAGTCPVQVTSEEGEFKMAIPFGQDVKGVPEVLVNVLRGTYPEAKYVEEQETPAPVTEA